MRGECQKCQRLGLSQKVASIDMDWDTTKKRLTIEEQKEAWIWGREIVSSIYVEEQPNYAANLDFKTMELIGSEYYSIRRDEKLQEQLDYIEEVMNDHLKICETFKNNRIAVLKTKIVPFWKQNALIFQGRRK